jgi:hypothetical protein
MGASVNAYWPGIEEELTEEQLGSHPGFHNDSKAWGDWIPDRGWEPRTIEAIRKLKADAILTFTTNGVKDEDVEWVTPPELREAAQELGKAIRAGLPETEIILESYNHAAKWVDSVKEHFLHDLKDIEAITLWAEEVGAVKMTLAVNW